MKTLLLYILVNATVYNAVPNQTDSTPQSYRRYLENTFRDVLKLHGTPVMIEFKKGDNPFKGRKAKIKKETKS
mgnify:CR=1 FL=1